MQQQIIQFTEHGGPEVLQPIQAEVPSPGPGQVLVRTAATGVNFIEIYQRTGAYQVPLPFTPGSEASGWVEAVGEGVTDLAVGDLVASSQAEGAYAQYGVWDAAVAAKVPDGVDPVLAAAVPLQGFTAHYLIHDSYRVRPGDTILTTAGAGGVGRLLTQLLKAAGATVITSVSGGPDGEKAAVAAAAGADHVLDYAEVPERVREITDGRGVDAVYDGVGQATFDASLASLRPRGTFVLFGAASGPVPPFELQRLNAGGSLSITRPSLKDFVADPAERAQRASDVFGAVADGTLSIEVGATFELAQAGEAQTVLASRSTTGKVLLTP